MKKWNKNKKILIVISTLFVAAQAIRPPKNQGAASGSYDITQTIAVPDNIAALLKASCYDCHSNHTDYPWYDQITPVNWWVANHINEGKKELNFSVFNEYEHSHQMKMLEGIGETVKSGEMPLNSYLIMHRQAKLSKAEKQAIFEWTRRSMTALSLKR